MITTFDNQSITISGKSVPYDPYYFSVASDDDNTDYRAVVKSVLSQWAKEIEQIKEGEQLFLPFGIYDECLECFFVTCNGKYITLKRTWLMIEGYTLNLRYLHEFINSKHTVDNLENFGEYDRYELFQSLEQAQFL